MPLWVPPANGSAIESNQTTTAAGGTTVTGSATVNTKGAWTQLIASTSFDAYGIMVWCTNTYVSATAADQLTDIGIGASGSEIVLIPDLLTGWVGGSGAGLPDNGGAYYFPLRIPAGSRVSARMQANQVSDTVDVIVVLFERPMIPGMWVGSRVTAYGVVSASSQGTLVTAGSGAYGSLTSLTASTTNPVRYMQIGVGGADDPSLGSIRCLARVATGSTVLIDNLFYETDANERVQWGVANSILRNCHWNLPAGIDLSMAAMFSSTATNTQSDFVIYGVD